MVGHAGPEMRLPRLRPGEAARRDAAETRAGAGSCAPAKGLVRTGAIRASAERPARLRARRVGCGGFLRERSGGGHHERERLGKAGRSPVAPCGAGAPSAHPDEGLREDGPVPAASNGIENPNGRARRMPANRRGTSTDRRTGAVFWFCCMSPERPTGFARTPRAFPDDGEIREWGRRAAGADDAGTEIPARWGEEPVWSELHHSTPYAYTAD